MFRTEGLVWTVGGRLGYPCLPNSLQVRVGEQLVTTIFNEYIQGYCEEHVQVDRSVFCLLNLASNVNRLYRELQEETYFWFKNPLMLLQQAKTQSLT
jgi:hypothetical protein